ncbi:MAG: amidohydrolase family protein [Candidatus Palauibacterales bacterium]|nr:amidohydrolase family protein [Candidatus Palauibacterales bacterium]MDP2529972.1 amidohydrolase family protein [Candidatus Palauibacterales bacterium]MDP2584329.1 amidohydrolase family protein [Candidatus Palauibacterales bacterium]
MILDFHNHYYPPGFLGALRSDPPSADVRVTEDAAGNPVLHYPGDYNVLVPGHRDLEVRARFLQERGVDCQLLTLTTPGTAFAPPERAVALARLVNDELAAAVQDGGGRFRALGHLPMRDPAAAAAELERCAVDLGLPGAMVFSNVRGAPLADDRFLPVWETADRLGAVIYIHPTYPLGVEAMRTHMLMPLVGFVADTSLAAAHLVFAGIPDRFPGVRWVLGHLGGTIPYIAERLDRGFEAFRSCRERLRRLPSEVLREFYYDTVNFDPAALRLAIEFAGTDHLVAGSDYPHMIGSMDAMLSSVRGLGLAAGEEAAVLGENAVRLLGFEGD